MFFSLSTSAADLVSQFSDSLGEVDVNTSVSGVYTFDVTDIGSSAALLNGSKIDIHQSGVYQISYSLSWRTTNNGRRQIKTSILKNNTETIGAAYGYARISGQAENATNTATVFAELQDGDFIELQYIKDGSVSGSALTNAGESWISVHLIEEALVTGSSCKTILDANPSSTDGIYTIDVDGNGPLSSVDVYCDMTTDGGGWTLISKYTGTTDSCVYAQGLPCASNELVNPVPDHNARLSDQEIYELVGSRTGVEFRSVSDIDDTVIARVDGGNPFDIAVVGMQFKCRDIDNNNWYSYTIDSAVSGFGRVTTWFSASAYVGYNDPNVSQCGDGISFNSTLSHPNPVTHSTQAIDAGYVSYAQRAGVFYLR